MLRFPEGQMRRNPIISAITWELETASTRVVPGQILRASSLLEICDAEA